MKNLCQSVNVPPETVDLLLTDPPYNVEVVGGSRAESPIERKKKGKLTITNDKMNSEDFYNFLFNVFCNAFSVMKNGAAFYVWYASKEAANFQTAIENAGLTVKQELIWNKSSIVMGRQDYQWKHEPCLYGWKEGAAHNWYADRKQTTVLEFNRPARNGEHPTMKPVELIAYQMQNSTKKGDTVLDLFGGSGTTLIAAEQTGRQCRMLELDERYADVIVKRFESLTGQKGILL